MSEDDLTAAAAMARLGISRQTLYAYVSRGLLRAAPDPADPRRSRYDARDVAAMLERRQRGRARHAVAASTIDWGEPVLPSRITRIADGHFFYRGEDAVGLGATATLEEVAALLWEADGVADADADPAPSQDGRPIERCLRAAATLAGQAIWARSPAALHRDAFRLLRHIAAAAGATGPGPIHQAFATGWGVPDSAGLLRRALVLAADHELNASAFAVRVVASTGAALPACVLGGLAALSGPLHGGMTERVAAMLAEPGMPGDPAAALAARLGRGDTLPGFGHRLYPAGDPRATALLAAMGPDPFRDRLIAAGTALTGMPPNIDLALALIARDLALPPGAAFALFATGRTAGWIAHALEQHQDGRLIRPRATYVGV
jgi:citrate synthase